jgi:hypothetical protein
MAVSTTIRRANFNTGYMGTINLYPLSTAGIVAGGVLTIAGDLGVTPIHPLPFNGWKTEVTGTPRGSARLIVRIGDTVTG